ncbi:transglutaminaseTgpA domain-containing protein [Streptomyces sp. M10(2022)]
MSASTAPRTHHRRHPGDADRRVLLIGLIVDALAVTFRSAAPAGLPARAVLGRGRAGRRQGGLALVPAGSLRLSAASAGGGPRPALPVGPGLRWLAAVLGRALGRVRGDEQTAAGPGTDRTAHRRGGAGVALVVPAALPALDGGLLGGAGGNTGRGSGGGTISAVNPLVSLQNNLNQPENREVMSYRTDAAGPQDFYLRILALDEFNGSEWRPSTRRLADVPGSLPQPAGLNSDVDVTQVRSNISASPSYQQTYLPLPIRRPRSGSAAAGGSSPRTHPRRGRRPDDTRQPVRGQQPGGEPDSGAARRSRPGTARAHT